MMLLGHETDVTEVDIIEKVTEKMAEYRLEDGSVLRFMALPTSILRLEGQFNEDGTPIYLVMSAPVTRVVSSPQELMRPKA
jgi:hypothetical protein